MDLLTFVLVLGRVHAPDLDSGRAPNLFLGLLEAVCERKTLRDLRANVRLISRFQNENLQS